MVSRCLYLQLHFGKFCVFSMLALQRYRVCAAAERHAIVNAKQDVVHHEMHDAPESNIGAGGSPVFDKVNTTRAHVLGICDGRGDSRHAPLCIGVYNADIGARCDHRTGRSVAHDILQESFVLQVLFDF